MNNPIVKLLEAAADLVLPPRCAGCGGSLPAHAMPAHAMVFCGVCAASLLPVSEPCDRCGLPQAGPRCRHCRSHPPPFSAVRAPLCYGGQLAVAVTRLKFGGVTHLARPLGTVLRPLGAMLACGFDVAVPVPLHASRLRERGFNQAALLARSALRRILPLEFRALIRARPGVPQTGLPRRQRLTNVAGAFVARSVRVRGRRVLLIDDVMTTGATAAACADALRLAGAPTVGVLTLARAVP